MFRFHIVRYSISISTNLIIKDNVHLTGVLPLPELLSLSRLNRLSLVHCNFHNADEALEQLSVHLPRCKVWI